MSATPDIIVIGAGIGGLAAALALLRAGHAVEVYEQSPTLGEIGAGLTIAPNASLALASLGLGDALAAVGSIPQESVNLFYATGETLMAKSLGTDARYPTPYYHVHRADLHMMLKEAVEAMRPGCIHLGKGLATLRQDADGVTAIFADGSETQAALLIGADGVRSKVREAIFGAENPDFTGRIAWRAVLPRESFGHLDLPARMGSVLGPGGTVAWYKMRGDSLLNLVFLAQWDQWVDEDWRARASADEVRSAYPGWCDLVGQLIDALPPEGVLRWGMFDRPPRHDWVAGRVALLGDAIHPMLPYLGQGAAMAIEDAVVLARALAAADPRTGLATYAATRRARTAYAQQASRERADLWEKTDQHKLAGNTARLDVQDIMYRYDAANVALIEEPAVAPAD